MATSASCLRAHKVPINVASSADYGNVRAGEWKLRKCVVIECSGLPCSCVVARLTGLRERSLNMIRIRCGLEILQMAAHAGGRSAGKLAADVTSGAWQL